MHVVTNRRQGAHREYVTHLLRRSYREGGTVKNETLANLSHLPPELIELIRGALRGVRYVPADDAFVIERSLPAGHVTAALAMARRLELARLIDRQPSRERDLVMAMICQRVIGPASKLATSRLLGLSTLADELSVAGADEDELYRALDWLGERQAKVEDRLARRHLKEGELVLYDVSSSYFEGRACPLARLGYSRDGRRGTPQIIYGLLCDKAGRPVSVEVFDGNLHDQATVPAQIAKLKQRFSLSTVVLVCDRGMVTKANIELLGDQGVGFITALKAPQVAKLVNDGELQLSLFDQHNLAEITSVDYPGERLIVCRNPLVAGERSRKREDLLAATEGALREIAERVDHGTLTGAAQIGLAVGALANRWKVRKHLDIQITDTTLTFARKTAQIDAEAALDGFYILRTSVALDELPAAEVVRSYKQLKVVERAFRTFKGPELEIRPIHHHLEGRVRAHVFLCTLAYYLTWHLQAAWKPLLFTDEHPTPSPDPVAKATRSPQALAKAQTKRALDGHQLHSYRSLLAELATQTRNTIRLPGTSTTFDKLAEPNPIQARALELIEHAPLST
ncbi:MAG TPA: IS1634 family transposase [Solirubrobacteraceae bacterium]|nr:IS1634 family transposase [Solirubrobacteraceae bacterium]